MSDKEQPNEISVKTATITESHEHESSITEAVDGNKPKYCDSNKRNCKTRARHPMIKALKKKSRVKTNSTKQIKNFLKEQRDTGSRAGREHPSTKAD